MPTGTAAHDFKIALYDAAVALWAGTAVQVVLGNPAQYQADDVVEFGDVSAVQVPATLSTNRAREEELTQTVIFSVYRGGGLVAERAVFDRAYVLLNALAQQVRVTDTTLGGVVRHCFLESNDYASGSSDGTVSAGRVGVIVARFGARVRVTS